MGALNRIVSLFWVAAPGEPESVAVEKYAPASDVPQMPATPVTQPVGSSGIGVYAGNIVDHEKSGDLRGSERYRKFEEWKRTVAEIGMALREWLILCGAPDWTVKPYKADDADEPLPEDVERAAFAQRAIHGMHTKWQRVVMEHALAPVDGARIGAWTMKVMPPGSLGTFGLDDIMTIPLSTIDRWDVDAATGRLRGVIQRDVNGAAEIPVARERLVYSRDLPTTTHPAGDGVMRFLAETIRRMLKLETLLDKGYEKDVNGIPIIYAPIIEKMAQIGSEVDGRTYARADFDRDMAAAVDFISAGVRKNAGLILDSSTFPDVEGGPSAIRRFAAEVLTAQASGLAELRQRVKDLGWNILAMLNSEHKAMGRDSGTQALHLSKESARLRAVSSFLNGFAEVVQYDILRPIWIVNGFDPANPTDPQNLPTPEWNALEFADNGSIVQSLAAILTAAGVEPGRADEIVDQVLANMGLPPLKAIDDEGVALRRELAAEQLGLGRPKPDEDEDDAGDALDDEGEED